MLISEMSMLMRTISTEITQIREVLLVTFWVRTICCSQADPGLWGWPHELAGGGPPEDQAAGDPEQLVVHRRIKKVRWFVMVYENSIFSVLSSLGFATLFFVMIGSVRRPWWKRAGEGSWMVGEGSPGPNSSAMLKHNCWDRSDRSSYDLRRPTTLRVYSALKSSTGLKRDCLNIWWLWDLQHCMSCRQIYASGSQFWVISVVITSIRYSKMPNHNEFHVYIYVVIVILSNTLQNEFWCMAIVVCSLVDVPGIVIIYI